MKICRSCAVDLAIGFDTDHFSKVDDTVNMPPEDWRAWEYEKPVEKETTKKFNPNKWQSIPLHKIEKALRDQADEKRQRFWRYVLFGFLIGAIISCLALFVAIFGSKG